MKAFAAALYMAMAQAELMHKVDYDFMRYVSTHNKMYGTVEEFELRKETFARADAWIRNVNSNPESTYTAGHNRFSDMTEDEKRVLFALKDLPKPPVDDLEYVVDDEEPNALPTSWDWRTQGAVTPVKDQGQCGSCWAFSSIEAIESAWIIKGNSMTIMSEQELVDCSSSTGNQGCNGGWYFWSYEWLANNYTMTEADYPYTSGTTGTETACAYNASKGVTKVASYGRTLGTSKNLTRIQQQPVNVAVAAGNNVFMYYTGGIITTTSGCPTSIDHAIVAVGWGVDNGTQYYIVRNSWGTDWGENGYVRIQTSGGVGVCGINQYVYYPTL